MSDKTLPPQSVVVPRDLVARLVAMYEDYRKSDLNHACAHSAFVGWQDKHDDWKALSSALAAPPAPSSLAGGEEAEFATALARVLDRHGLRDAGWADADIDEALSVVREPSAVSRATVDAILPMISERLAALSPEAPAPRPELAPYTEDLKGIKAAMLADEAPAEGAGERLLKPAGSKPTRCYCPPDRCDAPVIMGRQTPCIRARSSAPEAREGEVPEYAGKRREGAWAALTSYCPDETDGCTDLTPCRDCLKMVNVFEGSRYVCEMGALPALTHPAAPSADKLRTALSKIAHSHVSDAKAIALAALKAEGAK